MIGCHVGRFFQVTVAGGSYQEGLTAVLQGVPPGLLITEQEIYGDLLLRKPGADELSSPRKEPDLPVIYSGVNAADTIEGAGNRNHTNGTPLTILIPNLDRHFVHIKQYQDTNRTPRPGHASYASFMKYGPDDDAIGAGFFSGRYTATIVAAGYSVCPECGHEFFKRESDRQPKHDAAASSEGILSGEVTDETCPIQEVRYGVHVKRNAPPGAPRTMRVEYRISFHEWQSEWVCFEHTGYARHKAELWWRRRSGLPVPQTVEDAVQLAESGALAETKSITIRHVAGEEYGRIIGYELGEKPAYREPGWDDIPEDESVGALSGVDDDSIPF